MGFSEWYSNTEIRVVLVRQGIQYSYHGCGGLSGMIEDQARAAYEAGRKRGRLEGGTSPCQCCRAPVETVHSGPVRCSSCRAEGGPCHRTHTDAEGACARAGCSFCQAEQKKGLSPTVPEIERGLRSGPPYVESRALSFEEWWGGDKRGDPLGIGKGIAKAAWEAARESLLRGPETPTLDHVRAHVRASRPDDPPATRAVAMNDPGESEPCRSADEGCPCPEGASRSECLAERVGAPEEASAIATDPEHHGGCRCPCHDGDPR